MKRELTIHLIGNAHIDPVWLWRWTSGADEVINTSRTVCDLLDEYPEFRFTKGEAWGYSMAERYAPDVFRRIKAHVASGRWCIVNGWWVQPDCNFPLAESFAKQNEIGSAYFRDRFGVEVEVGYNVDSFGHTAFLPRMLNEMGKQFYVFMRPSESEMSIPANLFRWCSPDGGEVLTYRIDSSYTTATIDRLRQNIDQAVAHANRDLGHAMCFFGVGDHGGGPTREQIDWILDHTDYAPGVRLQFSDPARFFRLLRESEVTLPVLTGELQQHAIGCYSVAHDFRRRLRHAEWQALAAERLQTHPRNSAPQPADPHRAPTANPAVDSAAISQEARSPESSTSESAVQGPLAAQSEASAQHQRHLDPVWRAVVFNQFHDITGGCSIPTAMRDAQRQIDWATAECEAIITDHVRRLVAELDGADFQQIVLFNPAADDCPGPIEIEPWLGYPKLVGLDRARIAFLDEAGTELREQPVIQESAASMMRRFLVEVDVPAGASRRLEVRALPSSEESIHPSDYRRPAASELRVGPYDLTLGRSGLDRLATTSRHDHGETEARRSAAGSSVLAEMRIAAYDDSSDTWSHGIDRYSTDARGVFEVQDGWTQAEAGPLRFRYVSTLAFERSRAELAVSLYPDDERLELFVRIYWIGARQVVKLELVPGFEVSRRRDGVSGGLLERPLDGRELPIQGVLSLAGADDEITALSADVFAADVQPNGTARLTLLRSPYFAHHRPYTAVGPNYLHPATDQGMHEYRITLLSGAGSDEKRARELVRLQDSIRLGETTKRMKQ